MKPSKIIQGLLRPSAVYGVAVFLSLSACTTAPAPQSDQIVNPARIQSELDLMVEEERVAGAMALVFEDGQEVFFGTSGFADREAGEPMQRDTLIQIYSMSKPIAGVALMTLYEDGSFELDDPITDYVPELAGLQVFDGYDDSGEPVLVPLYRPLTVLDFMRHTAGLAGDGDDSYPGEVWRELDPTGWDNTLPELAEKMGQVPLAYQPGAEWRYSSAVDIQALMVERLSGRPYDEYVQETIFEPLGMTEITYTVTPDDVDRLAAVYETQDDGTLTRVPDEGAYQFAVNDWTLTPGSFGFTSTIDDYARFSRMLLGSGELDGVRILEPETVELMRTNFLSDDVEERSWLPTKGQVGFGIDFAVRTAMPEGLDENYGYTGEFFWDGYMSTLFWVDPENDLTAVFFTQNIPFNWQVHKLIRDAVYDQSGRSRPEK